MLLNVSRAPVLCFFAFSICAGNPPAGKRVSFNEDWRFHLGDRDSKTRNDYRWRKLDLPHDWSIEGEFVKTILRERVAEHHPAESAQR